MDIFVVLGLFLLVTALMPWINRGSISNLKNDIRDLQDEIRQLREFIGQKGFQPSKTSYSDEVSGAERASSGIAFEPTREYFEKIGRETESVPDYPEKPVMPTVPHVEAVRSYQQSLREQPAEKAPKEKISFEQNIGTRITVWIGAIALAFAGFYLVKYSIDNNLISPAVRLIMGGIFGCSMISAGQFLSYRPHFARNERIPQALVGAGIVTLYGCIYAALDLYQFLNPAVAFTGMTLVTFIAIVMSLRHGAPIALFGITGGMLTPLMVGSDSPNVPMLLAYLFVFYSGLLYVLWRKRWWSLAIVALTGGFLWPVAILLNDYPSDFVGMSADAILAYLLGVGLVSLVAAISQIRSDEEANTNISFRLFNLLSIAGACAIITLISYKVPFGAFEWGCMAVFSLAVMVLSYFDEKSYKNLVWGKFTLDIFLFALLAQDQTLAGLIVVVSILAVPYLLAPFWFMRKVPDPKIWAALQSIFALAAFLVAYYIGHRGYGTQGSDDVLWSSVSFMLFLASMGMTAYVASFFKSNESVRNFMEAVYSLTASFFLSLSLVILLPYEYLPLAISTQILATMIVYKAVRIDFLKTITFLLTLLFIGLNYEFIFVFMMKMVQSLFGENPGMALPGMPWLMLMAPSIFISAASFLWWRSKETATYPLATMLYCTAAAALIACLYIGVRVEFYPYEMIIREEAGFIERNIVTFMFAVIACLFAGLQWAYKITDIRKISFLLTGFALARLMYFDVFLHNPYFSYDQLVGGMPILNGVTFAYGMGILLTLFALKTRVSDNPMTIKGISAMGFVFLFCLVTFNVRQIFHGSDIDKSWGYNDNSGSPGDVELYTYSIVWLLTGIALVSYGIFKESKAARTASLVFMLLAVAKVFFVDAAQLEGLYRVFSFLGLGLSLIGLSFFYSRFVFAKTKETV